MACRRRDWSGEHDDTVTMYGRGLRVGYTPVQVRFTVKTPRGRVAPNSGTPIKVALDPEVLLVPVEVVYFHAPGFAKTTGMQEQMLIWDQIPVFSATGNTRITNGGTGELTAVERAWEAWPVLGPSDMYQYRDVLAPDGIWSKAGIRFRLVNYFEVETDRDHVIQSDRLDAPAALRDNFRHVVYDDPRHIGDRMVLVVILMHRIKSRADDMHIGQAFIGEGALGASWGVSDRLTTIPHEIGHLITGLARHSDVPNNIMQETGGFDITPGQRERARTWAARYASFWRRP